MADSFFFIVSLDKTTSPLETWRDGVEMLDHILGIPRDASLYGIPSKGESGLLQRTWASVERVP